MKIRVRFFCLLSSCFLLYSCTGSGIRSSNNEENVGILHYPGAYNLVSRDNSANDTLTIFYEVKLTYASKDVLEFYDGKLKAMGWIPYSGNFFIDNREWENFVDMTIDGQPLVHQLVAYWINTREKRLAGLVIRYYSFDLSTKEALSLNIPTNDIQNISFKVFPFQE